MRISIFHPHLMDAVKQTGLSFPMVLETVRGYGVEGVECDVKALFTPDKDALLRAGLCFASVYANYAFERECDMDAVRRDADAVAECGCKKLLVIPGFIRKEQEDRRPELMESIRDGLEKTTRYATSLGLTVSLEDYDNAIAPFSTIAGLKWFMDRVEGVGFTFDTGNFLYSEESALDAFAALGGKLVHVHCKDRSFDKVAGEEPLITVKGRELYTSPVGCGCIPMKDCLTLVKRSGYDDWLSAEHFGSLDQLGYTQKSAAWLRETWDSIQ